MLEENKFLLIYIIEIITNVFLIKLTKEKKIHCK